MYTSGSGLSTRMQLLAVVLSVVVPFVAVLKTVLNVVVRGVVLYVVVLGVTDWGITYVYLFTASLSSLYVILHTVFKHSRISISIGHIFVLLERDVCGEVTGVVTVEVCVEVTGVDVVVVIRVLNGVSVVEKHLRIISFSLFGTG